MDETVKENNTQNNNSLAWSVFEWLELLAIAVAIVMVVLTCIGRHSPVIGSSMNETLQEKDVLIISDLFYKPKQGDIIVFESKATTYEKPFVKRVIATEGQVIDYDPESGVIKVDGEILKEDYATYKGMQRSSYQSMYEGKTFRYPYTVPDGCVFAMGDNRWNSHDCRDIGPVDERCIIGHVLFRVLPFDSFGKVS